MRQLRVPKGSCPVKLSDPKVARACLPPRAVYQVTRGLQSCAMTWQDYDSFINPDQAGACGCSASAAAAAASRFARPSARIWRQSCKAA